jgi:molecular chaperone GrpE
MVSVTVQKLSKESIQEKIDELQKELEEKTKLAEDRLNSLRYIQADFDNYRKTFEKEKEKIIELANENLIRDLLSVADDFDTALKLMDKEKNNEGLAMIRKNFFKVLENHGLKRIEALGKKFDPYYHEALIKEKSNGEDGTISEEIQAGYMLKSKVIRHSKVKVVDNKLVEVSVSNG